MRHDSQKLRNDFADKLNIPALHEQAYLTHACEQEWQDMLKNIRDNYISAFAQPLDGGEDDWTHWQKRYGPEILDAHHQRTAQEIENFLDFMRCDPKVSKRIGEIMSIHDCGKADPSLFRPEDWVRQERPGQELRRRRSQHTKRSQAIFDAQLETCMSLKGETGGFCQLARQILGDHHDLQSNNPLIRAIAIIDAYDGDTHHHWPHQGEAPRDAMSEFRRLLGIDEDRKYAGKTDTDLVLQYAKYKQHHGENVDHDQLKGELDESRHTSKPRGPAATTAVSMNK